MQDAFELKNFLHSPKPTLLIIGKTRSHKTHLLSKAISFSDPNHMVLRLKGRSNLQPSTLTTLFSKHWAIQSSETDELESHAQLDHALNCLYLQNQTCLLLVEQAHLLPISVLTALCHLSHQQENKSICVRIILVGCPELVSKINALYPKKFPLPNAIYLAEITNTPKKRKRYWQTQGAKTMMALTLCMSGFLWWKMQENSVLLHAHQSAKNQTEQKPLQPSFA